MNVTVTRQYRIKEGGSSSNVYSFSVGSSGGTSSGGTSYTATPPAVIAFADTAEPSILNYQDNYAALYGPWPRFLLVSFDEDDNLLERADKPKRNIVGDVLDSIVWDFGGIKDSGLIIIYPTT